MKTKKKIGLFALGVLTGAALCAAAFVLWPGGTAAPAPSPEAAAIAAPTALPAVASAVQEVIPADETPLAAVQSYPAWESGAVYLGGDRVLYEGRIYRAKWWTQGEKPGGADVWEDTLETPAAPTPARTAQPAKPSPRVETAEGFKVVGYYPSWKPDEMEKLRWDVLTHVVYAFAIPTEDGGLRPLEHPETARALVAQAHENGAKALLAVGGWSYNDVPLEPAFVAATSGETRLRAFGDAIVALCTQYGFDGVDMDWEHPRVDGPSGKQYQQLMLYLAERLHAQDKLLTSAVLSGATADGNVYYDAAAHSDAVLSAVDWIHVMAYDGGDGARHSPYGFAEACGRYWSETRGLAASKVVLGMPFYARPSWAGYGDLLAEDPGAWNTDHIQYRGMEAWYNGMATIQKKTEYAGKHLGGVMIWEVTQDALDQDKSLMTAVKRGLAG